jgi:hypothetical protein
VTANDSECGEAYISRIRDFMVWNGAERCCRVDTSCKVPISPKPL